MISMLELILALRILVTSSQMFYSDVVMSSQRSNSYRQTNYDDQILVSVSNCSTNRVPQSSVPIVQPIVL